MTQHQKKFIHLREQQGGREMKRMTQYAQMTSEKKREKGWNNPKWSRMERNSEADYEEERLESDVLPNTGTIA